MAAAVEGLKLLAKSGDKLLRIAAAAEAVALLPLEVSLKVGEAEWKGGGGGDATIPDPLESERPGPENIPPKIEI